MLLKIWFTNVTQKVIHKRYPKSNPQTLQKMWSTNVTEKVIWKRYTKYGLQTLLICLTLENMTPHLRFKRNPHLTYKMTPHLWFIRTPYKSVFLTHFMALIYLTPDNMTTHLTFNRTPHRSLFNASHATRRTDGASLLCPLELSLRRFNKRS